MGILNQTLSSEFCALLKAKDRKGFELLYDQYGSGIYNLIHNCVGSEPIAKELFREALCAIWENINQFLLQNETFFVWSVSVVGKIVSAYVAQHNSSNDSVHRDGKDVGNIRPISSSSKHGIPLNVVPARKDAYPTELRTIYLPSASPTDLSAAVATVEKDKNPNISQISVAKHIMQVLREAKQAKQRATEAANHKNSA
ncbi:RNA polymerase sigma factor [Sphingobacterium deserti]|uniref:RNA polymerase, sigma-24 subunit, ECF subfamily n=1 Tax=Sphingobacterium deserti TaxID=1229276 RepID=A0A0B8T668_9SPHI|nr:hypothetical protein [Sphingobacterium deserti]KGE13384.1 RNA polymerase, sigma-24 subunit, ECF subfamily [Sphingobacterium deserti]